MNYRRACFADMGRIVFLYVLLLGGCALFPLSEADCRPASWRQRGYDDGYFGSFPQDLRSRRNALATASRSLHRNIKPAGATATTNGTG
jgi:hypothetical protein